MRILWLKSELLHPVDKGGRIRTYQTLRALARAHHITYLTLDDGHAATEALALAHEYAHDVLCVPFHPPVRRSTSFYLDLVRNLFSPYPYAIAKYRSPQFTAEVARLASQVDLIVCDFLTQAINVPGVLPVPAILFQHNVEAEIWRRHSEVASSPVARGYFREQYRRMVRFERDACRRFDHVVAVSEEDAALMRTEYGVERVSAVPTGVDLEYFQPQPGVPRSRQELVFTGSMDWLPNEDGVSWFAGEVLPLIRAEAPAVTLTIVGRNPSPRVQALAARHAGVTVTGTVPDVRPYLARGAALVVPLRIGGGTRLKIYEAMAMGVPVISTTVGAEGLPLTPGGHFLQADTPEMLADACLQAIRNPAAASELGEAGAQYVRDNFGWARVAEAFTAICAGAVTAVAHQGTTGNSR